MSNTQLYVSVGVPFFTLLLVFIATAVSNRSTVNDLRADNHGTLNDLRAENRNAINDLRSEMRAGFDAINGRLDRLENKLDRLTEEVYKLHEGRISRLEERVFSRAS